MPLLSPVCSGSFSSAAAFTSHSLVFILDTSPPILVHGAAERTDVIRRTAAAGAQNVHARLQQRHYAPHHLLRSLVVNHFHLHQLGLSRVGLRHHRQIGNAPVPQHRLPRPLHI